MRILEIMSTPVQYSDDETTVDRETSRFLKKQMPQTAASAAQDQLKLGAGSYGTAYDTPKTPTGMNIVTKIHRMFSPSQDGYVNFLKQLKRITADHPNPYLPQIYSVTVKDQGKESVAVVEMEKLQPALSLSIQQIRNIFTKLGQGSLRGFELPNPGDDKSHVKHLKKLEEWVDEAVMHPKEHQWLDPEFLEACELIHRLDKHDLGLIDISLGNIMYRATPYGPQLVITDPLE